MSSSDLYPDAQLFIDNFKGELAMVLEQCRLCLLCGVSIWTSFE